MNPNDRSSFGFTSHPTTLGLASIILLALLVLVLLRHFFGSIRVEAGTH